MALVRAYLRIFLTYDVWFPSLAAVASVIAVIAAVIAAVAGMRIILQRMTALATTLRVLAHCVHFSRCRRPTLSLCDAGVPEIDCSAFNLFENSLHEPMGTI